MKQEYFQILDLLQEQGNALPRYEKIHEIIQQPCFQYEQGSAADFVLDVFLKSSYWLDRELFDDAYLYSKEGQNLSPTQRLHLKMVDIGISLMNKGFPIKYNPSEYTQQGPDQLKPYIETFVKQIHNKHMLENKKRITVSLVAFQKKKRPSLDVCI